MYKYLNERISESINDMLCALSLPNRTTCLSLGRPKGNILEQFPTVFLPQNGIHSH